MAPFKVEGFVVATFTPFTNEGEVNWSMIDTYQQYLLSLGIKHIYVNGSTGEGPSLTLEERKRLCEEWMKYCRLPGREMTVLVQIGGCCFRDAVELTKHAIKHKVDAISALPPLYFPPPTSDGLVDYCKGIAQAAPNTPFYYYNIPERTGIGFDMEEFLIKARDKIPSLRGIKYTSKDIYQACRCLRTLDKNGHPFDLLYGSDEQVMTGFVTGFKGVVGSTYNWMPEVYQRMKACLDVGKTEEAKILQYRSVDAIKLMFKYGFGRAGAPLPAMRIVMASRGMDLGPPRFPIVPLSRDEADQLMAELRGLGFHDWIKKGEFSS